jgi:hypothetical protein
VLTKREKQNKIFKKYGYAKNRSKTIHKIDNFDLSIEK